MVLKQLISSWSSWAWVWQQVPHSRLGECAGNALVSRGRLFHLWLYRSTRGAGHHQDSCPELHLSCFWPTWFADSVIYDVQVPVPGALEDWRKFLLSLWNGSRCGWITWVCYRCGKFQWVIFLLFGVISSSCSWRVLETPLQPDMELVYTSELRCLMVNTHHRWSCLRLVWLLPRLWQYHAWSSWDIGFVLGWCLLCISCWNVQMFPSGVGRTPWWHSVGSEIVPPSGSCLWLTEYERSKIWLIPVNGSTAVESSTLLISSPDGWELRSWCLQNFEWRVLCSWFILGQNHPIQLKLPVARFCLLSVRMLLKVLLCLSALILLI